MSITDKSPEAAAETARLMDAVYRNQRHFYDLTRKYYLLGRDRLIDRLDLPGGATVLELGCGTGRNLIAAAKRYPDARFFGVDISEHMLETARHNVARAGLSDRIFFRQGDAADPSAADAFGLETFDRVIYSYTLSMIPVWREALKAGMARLAPDGRLSVVDFGQQEGMPGLFKTLLFLWLSKFHVSPRADLKRELGQLSAANGAILEATDLYRGYAWYAEISRPAGYSPATK
ncbi:class I SAM-dependent methyltransferase [uncultured Roseibium sp.]|uniref:class I SAM-dependent methyltransferase n=1 Tax=uncultured Roseibium sp. TaxID=1936171 RepID=UPI003217D245